MNDTQPSNRIRIDPIHTSIQGFSSRKESPVTEIVALYITDTSMQSYEILFTVKDFVEYAKTITDALELMKETL